MIAVKNLQKKRFTEVKGLDELNDCSMLWYKLKTACRLSVLQQTLAQYLSSLVLPVFRVKQIQSKNDVGESWQRIAEQAIASKVRA